LGTPSPAMYMVAIGGWVTLTESSEIPSRKRSMIEIAVVICTAHVLRTIGAAINFKRGDASLASS
jgi:hypothetical protein